MTGTGGGPVEVELRLPAWARGVPRLRHGLTTAALLLVAASLVLKGWLLSRSYFVEDDIVFVGRAVTEPFGWAHLLRVHIGHLMPGALALVRALTAISPYDWGLVSAVVLALSAAAALALYRLLRLLFGARPMVLVPLVFFLFSPANFQATAWFAAAINILPLHIAMLMAMCSQALLVRTGRVRHAAAGLAWTCAGLLFFEKAVLIPPVLFLLTVVLLAGERGMLGAARRHLGLWLVHAAVAGAYLAGYLAASGRSGGQGITFPDFYTAVDYAATFFGGTVPTLLVGGPLTWEPVLSAGALAGHRPVEIAVAWLALAAVVAGTCRARRAAVPAWLLAGGYLLVADGLLIMIVRSGPSRAFESRYIADALPLLTVCLALALMTWRGAARDAEAEAVRRGAASPAGSAASDPAVPDGGARTLPVYAVPAACAYVALALVSASVFGPTLPGRTGRAYFDAARADLAALGPETGVYPALVPERMLFPWQSLPDRLTSRALAPLARGALRERIAHPGVAYDAVTFDDRGHLVPAAVLGGFVAGEDGGCLPWRGGAVTADLAVREGNVVRLHYDVPRDTRVTVTVGERRTEVTLRADRERVHLVTAPAPGPVRITLMDGSLPNGSLPNGSLPNGSLPDESLPDGSRRDGGREGGVCLRAVVVGAAVPERPEGAVDGGAG
ncbi:hypothetical protein [Streptosporangium pseudovulgare]|uniref:Glycosyltransferase RgtA/B/C/D-like domain-containing protein n=1 Tax=Streptosporangium pseudovulgare TaxID=35765 RepID=A0ABQ2QMN2_9ACTN|nr:hypothetical protein [Streptosporangium pseudovulgare]GGP87211.1 hypothetical protein GCM10010140_15580 [Streptosporangium pseudovulgare]